MKIIYYDLYSHQFEQLVVLICHKILGPGVREFSIGKDGGRDAIFHGTACNFPSTTSPLSGKILIQAKHTFNPIAKVSDLEFSGITSTSTLTNEISKVKNLHSKGDVDHYLLFTNRKIPAESTLRIEDRIKKETNLDSVFILGIETIDRLLKSFPNIVTELDLKPFDAPLRVSPDEIAEVINKLDDHKKALKGIVANIPKIERTSFDEKNSLNNLTEEYSTLISKKYLKDFSIVKSFLANPDCQALQEKYDSACDEFQSAIISHRDDYDTFDKVLDYLFQHLTNLDPDLSKRRILTRTVLYYMYWNCDIGKGRT